MDHTTSRPTPAWTLKLLTGFVLLAMMASTGTAQRATGPTQRVVVEATSGVRAAAQAVAAAGGQATRALDAFGLLVADVPTGRLDELRRDGRVRAVTTDQPMQVQADAFTAGVEPVAALQTIGAPSAWSAGHTGEGIGIALVDTGVSAHPDLAGRITAAFDLSGEDSPADGYGHGTFLAGLAAGDATASEGRYPGVAPDAHVVSIKVAGADGTTSLSQVLTGLAVAERTSDELGIRVVLLALSGPAGPVRDPLQTALERLWTKGLFVVVAAGNTGPEAGSVGSPGIDPYVLTVGATDDAGTNDPTDDTVPDWSAAGPTPAGLAKPDVIAPGTRTVSLRAAGSAIDRNFPSARVDEHYLRGSGTSMASAMVAGAAAVVLEANPQLTPDQLKGRFMFTASAAPVGSDPAAVGHGSVDLPAAVSTATPPANGTLPRATGTRRGASKGNPSLTPEVTGWRWAGDDWSGWRWAGDDWSGWRWAGDDWSGWRWAGDDWSGWRWAGDDWSGWRWAGDDWSGWRWAGFVPAVDPR